MGPTGAEARGVANASRFEDYQENVVNWAGALYRCDNLRSQSQARANRSLHPLDMRAPGAAVGVYALECAMDELSYALGIDPLELRLRNYSEIDQNEDKPFTSKALKDCYYQGRRAVRLVEAATGAPLDARGTRAHRLRHGDRDLGSLARADQRRGRAYSRRRSSIVSTAAADIGTGTYTILAQIGGEMLGLPLDKVRDQDRRLRACRNALSKAAHGRRRPRARRLCRPARAFASKSSNVRNGSRIRR